MIANIVHDSKSIVDEYFDCLIKSRFIELFGTIDLSAQKPEWVELGKLGKILTGSTPKTNTEEYWNGDIKWIAPAELTSESFYIYDTERKITEAGRNSCSLNLLKPGVVLLSSRAPIGKVAIVGSEMYCNQGFKNVECSPDLNSVYLYILLKNNSDYLNSLGRGATFKEISAKIVESIKIPAPSIELQNQFEEFVKQVDKSRSVFVQEMERFDELVKSRFIELFGDVLKNDKGFQSVPFGDYVDQMNIGPFGSDLKNDCFVSESEGYCMVYEQKHAIDKDFTVEKRFVTKEKYEQMKRFDVGPGDILVSCRGTIGKCVIIPDGAKHGIIHPSLMMIKPKDGVNREFLLVLLEKILEVQIEKGSGVKMAIKATELSKVNTILPPRELQDEYVNFSKQVDKSRNIVLQRLISIQPIEVKL